jgi:uncharacterized OB-fold protein
MCGSEEVKDAEMPKTGTIVSYTVLHEPLPGFEAHRANGQPVCFST